MEIEVRENQLIKLRVNQYKKVLVVEYDMFQLKELIIAAKTQLFDLFKLDYAIPWHIYINCYLVLNITSNYKLKNLN